MPSDTPHPVSFDQVFERIRSRRSADPAESYVASLSARGEDALLKKVGEECCELLLAAKNAPHGGSGDGGQGQDARAAVVHELADLWFHVMLWMAHAGYTLEDVRAELGARFGRSGLNRGADPGSN